MYGFVDQLHLLDVITGTFMLYRAGIGVLSYAISVRFDEVELVAMHEPSPLAA